ncbi:hypothetical protein L484_023081 [Morus notabilis]|uniref:Uncharacterized protein n=1 Tax=Morus notabilis TaxID=981085 RepID=W9RL79_9ROSA|nr:hypothetical protein L484_023081 [Morus notabilis]
MSLGSIVAMESPMDLVRVGKADQKSSDGIAISERVEFANSPSRVCRLVDKDSPPYASSAADLSLCRPSPFSLFTDLRGFSSPNIRRFNERETTKKEGEKKFVTREEEILTRED